MWQTEMSDLFHEFTLSVVIWGIYAGLIAASVITFITGFGGRKAVRALLAAGATDTESARTAGDLGLTGIARRALGGSLYGKLFVCANEFDALDPSKKQNPYKRPKLNMDVARFYIPEEKKYQAEDRFPKASVPALIAAIVLLTGFFTLLHFFLPSAVDAVITYFGGN